MSTPRGLSAEEAAAWAKLAQSVNPIAGRKRPVLPEARGETAPATKVVAKKPVRAPAQTRPKVQPQQASVPLKPQAAHLDGTWDRKLKSGDIAPDYTLDLHGHSLDSAYTRIMSGLDQARAMGARVVLVIAGRERPVDPADRANKRGAIRSKMLDWLAASHHADAISAVRRAHIRHGGAGALYLVLRRS